MLRYWLSNSSHVGVLLLIAPPSPPEKILVRRSGSSSHSYVKRGDVSQRVSCADFNILSVFLMLRAKIEPTFLNLPFS